MTEVNDGAHDGCRRKEQWKGSIERERICSERIIEREGSIGGRRKSGCHGILKPTYTKL